MNSSNVHWIYSYYRRLMLFWHLCASFSHRSKMFIEKAYCVCLHNEFSLIDNNFCLIDHVQWTCVIIIEFTNVIVFWFFVVVLIQDKRFVRMRVVKILILVFWFINQFDFTRCLSFAFICLNHRRCFFCIIWHVRINIVFKCRIINFSSFDRIIHQNILELEY
jgi:hypothetical protein